ncbi:MAG: hypothetical protein ACFKPT_25110 [Gloeotrichia echinulata GP01]
MSRQIKDLNEATAAADTDWLLLQESSGGCKKISKSNFVAGLATSSATPSVAPYQSGMALWLENGELADKSGNGRNAVATASRRPYKVNAFGGKNAFYWDGKDNQQLQVPFFLSGAIGATIYIVYSVNSPGYELIRTRENGDWWRFWGDGNGYIGTLRTNRMEGYPGSMPSTGEYLLSIHSSPSVYEVTMNGISKGVQGGQFNAGDRFLIGVNQYSYIGAIGLILVYPSYIASDSVTHSKILSAISTNYTTLTIVSEYVS